MPFNFDPAKYKNVFVGEFGESPLTPSQINPGAETWNVKIYKLRVVPNSVDGSGNPQREKYSQQKPCQICGDSLAHEHAFMYESERPNSPTAEFIFSLRDNGNLVVNDPKAIEGRRFTFEEKIKKGNTNPTTGLPGKDQRYFVVVGLENYEAQQDEAEAAFTPPTGDNASNSAPSGQPASAINAPTSQPVAQSPAVNKLAALAKLADGNPSTEEGLNSIRSAAKGVPEIFDDKGFFIDVLQGTAFELMVSQGFATKDESGVFHAA